jgi:predicted Zn-dependent protease
MNTLRNCLQHIIIAVLLSLAMFTSCSVNPATGERHLNLISEQQEIGIGRQADQEISAAMGLYNNAELQKYVSELGKRLAATSERPDLPWSFKVVDDPVVNAFALPGGFIYVTRGILAHMNNEAELAGVMGHEIGHVTAQHSVNRMSTQQLTQLGLGVGMILKPELQQYGQLASQGLGLLFLKFSRDDESQADALGVRYMRRISEDPRQMAEVMTMLDNVTKASGGGRVPEWLATHPDPGNRREAIQAQLDTVTTGFSGTKVNAQSYISHLNGVVFGDNPREGFFKGNTFMQPELKFRFDFPEGWKTQNQKASVIAVSPQQDAQIQISLAKDSTANGAARGFFSQQGIIKDTLRSLTVHGLRAQTGGFSAQTEQGGMRGMVTFVEFSGNVYQIEAYSSQQQWAVYAPAVQRSFGSFDRLTDTKALSVQPMRLKIITLTQPMTLEQFNQKYPSSVSLETVALINQIELITKLPSGRQMKQVVGEKPQ